MSFIYCNKVLFSGVFVICSEIRLTASCLFSLSWSFSWKMNLYPDLERKVLAFLGLMRGIHNSQIFIEPIFTANYYFKSCRQSKMGKRSSIAQPAPWCPPIEQAAPLKHSTSVMYTVMLASCIFRGRVVLRLHYSSPPVPHRSIIVLLKLECGHWHSLPWNDWKSALSCRYKGSSLSFLWHCFQPWKGLQANG